jgi:hypothetical protein
LPVKAGNNIAMENNSGISQAVNERPQAYYRKVDN